MPSIADQLTAARKAAGMTQEQLADAVHVARSTVSSWERGRTQPDLDTLLWGTDANGEQLTFTAYIPLPLD